MIESINNNIKINKQNSSGNRVFHKSCLADSVSFKGNPVSVIVSQHPGNVKSLMYISLNNISKKTKNIFSRFIMNILKYMTAFADSSGAVLDTNSQLLLAVKGSMIKGGIIAQKVPQEKAIKCSMLVVDTATQSKKDSIKTLFELGKGLYKSCKENKIEKIEWDAGSKNKGIINLFNKISVKSNLKREGNYTFVTYTDHLKEFLEKIAKKHSKILG